MRGSVRQVFGVLGFVGGLWVAVMVSRWVGAQWLGARPAVVLWVSRLIVAGIAGLVVAGLLRWCGNLLGMAVQAGPAGWLDRVLGVALGAAIGVAWALALVLLLVFLPERVGAGPVVRGARTAHAVVGMGTRGCDSVGPWVPVLRGTGRVLREAERRLRAADPTPAGADSSGS